MDKNPKHKKAHYYLGIIYDKQGKIENSINEFKEVIKIDPKSADAYNYIGYTYADKGMNLDEAFSFIKKAMEIEPDNEAYIDSLGWVYYKKGMLNEALVELKSS